MAPLAPRSEARFDEEAAGRLLVALREKVEQLAEPAGKAEVVGEEEA